MEKEAPDEMEVAKKALEKRKTQKKVKESSKQVNIRKILYLLIL